MTPAPVLRGDPVGEESAGGNRGAAEPMSSWYVYVLECERGKLYTGISPDVEKRFERHAAGKGGAFTRFNRPHRIIAAAEFPDRAAATRAEIALKRIPREQKLRWAHANAWRPAGGLSVENPPGG